MGVLALAAPAMTRWPWLLAGFVLGAVGSAVGQPSPIQLHTAAIEANTLAVSTSGHLIARCVRTPEEAALLGYELDRLPVCRELPPDPVERVDGCAP